MSEGIKWPRVTVSKSRHAKLRKIARDRKTTMEEVAEEMFKQAESK